MEFSGNVLVKFQIPERRWPLIFQGSKAMGFDNKAAYYIT